MGSDEFYDAEHALLQALQRQDLDTLTALLTDDFLIPTAGWIAEPADKSTWLAGLAEHQLAEPLGRRLDRTRAAPLARHAALELGLDDGAHRNETLRLSGLAATNP